MRTNKWDKQIYSNTERKLDQMVQVVEDGIEEAFA